MTKRGQGDLIELFRAFLSHYPSMRFGQAVCGVSAWEKEDLNESSDDELATTIKEHLERRFGEGAYETASSSLPAELAQALREIRQAEPTDSLGRLVFRLSVRANANPYDIENDELSVAIRAELATLHQGSVG